MAVDRLDNEDDSPYTGIDGDGVNDGFEEFESDPESEVVARELSLYKLIEHAKERRDSREL